MYNSYGFLPPPGKMHFTWNRPWRIQVMLLQCNYEMYHVWLWQTQFRSYTSRERGGHVVERKQGRVSKHGRESEQAEKDIKRDEEMPQIKRVKRIESDRVFIQVRLTWKIEWKLQHSFCCCHRMRNIVPAKKKAVVKYDGKAWNWQYHWNSHDCNEHFNPILIFNNIPKITKVNFDSYQKKKQHWRAGIVCILPKTDSDTSIYSKNHVADAGKRWWEKKVYQYQICAATFCGRSLWFSQIQL